ncbi:hypothetical protein IJJ39_02175 [Candidatus Saccharibacteria bacterium]|nr:hypothetical protein [Candidatus Saccharibacteria bacterium]
MYTTTYNEPVLISTSTTDTTGMGIWAIIAAILAIVGGILVYFLFVKAKQEPKGKFLTWFKDFLAFKSMWLEPILKISYYVETIFVVLVSFSLIGTNFLAFLGTLILGPIIVRLVYELIMMFIMIWRNTTDIARNTKKQ